MLHVRTHKYVFNGFFRLLVVFFSLLVKKQVSYFTWALSAHGLKDSVQKYKTHGSSDIGQCNTNIHNRMTRIPWERY